MSDETSAAPKLRRARAVGGEPKPKVGGKKRPGGRTAAAKGNGAGHPSEGDGWGGPARGEGAGPEALVPGQPPEKRSRTAENVRTRAERVAALEDQLFDLAMSAEREETQVSAAKSLHAIYEGQPVAKTISAQVDDIERLNDVELRAELERLSRASSEAREGASKAGMPAEPSGVVH